MLISVVLPVYNVAPYIDEAIDSILNQTIQDFEIIVIDDCSTDKTIEIIKSFNDQRIKILTKSENKGLIDSLNIGFKAAKGKYIARMDGDDISDFMRFEKQLHVLENNPTIKVCGSWLQAFGKENKIIKHKENHEQILVHMMAHCSMSLCAVMIDRAWVKDECFNEEKKHVEDYDFWSRVIWKGKLYNIQEVLYHYRTHENQVSNKYNHIQRKGDIPIKLVFFKKLNYNQEKFKDSFFEKMFLQKEYFTIEEFSLFLAWFSIVQEQNKKLKIYNQSDFNKVIKKYKTSLIYKIYFHSNFCKIDKKWRITALTKLSFPDLFFVFKLKIKEKLKF
ncbi:glycosyltransferase family 2 protein [Flavobacterium psychrophilum]|nr:glycosyltransferase family 2 protein [Flavobacterium psychrophilum]